jgi:cytochrome c6
VTFSLGRAAKCSLGRQIEKGRALARPFFVRCKRRRGFAPINADGQKWRMDMGDLYPLVVICITAVGFSSLLPSRGDSAHVFLWRGDWLAKSKQGEFYPMKRFAMAVALLAMISGVAVAEDGAAIYKTKCAMCHGAAGEGKVGPALKGTKLTDAQVADLLTKGAAGKKAPHGKAVAGLTDDQAKAVATFVKGLK